MNTDAGLSPEPMGCPAPDAAPPETDEEPLCAGAGPCEEPCEEGFAIYPQIDPSACLRVCVYAELNDDADVAELAAEHCEVVEGDLSVSRGVTSLVGLESIRFVTRYALIDDGDLSSLRGLDGLERVENNMFVTNTQVVNLEGLGALRAVGGLFIQGNNQLESLRGLEALRTTVGSQGWINITENRSLASLDGLESLGHVIKLVVNTNDLSGTLELPCLQSVETFAVTPEGSDELVLPSLTSADWLNVTSGTNLTRVSLPLLTSIAGRLRVQNNTALEVLNVPALSDVAELNLEANPQLTELHGPMLERLSRLILTENEQLDVVDLPVLARASAIQIGSNGVTRLAFPALDQCATVWLSANPWLEQFEFPMLRDLRGGDGLIVNQHPLLTQFDFPALESATAIDITDNESLQSVSFGALDSVERLSLARNPELPACATDPLIDVAGRCQDCELNADPGSCE